MLITFTRALGIAAASYALVLQYFQFSYLRRGYDLTVSLFGSASSTHIAFPLWRQIAICPVATLLVGGVVLALLQRFLGVLLLAASSALALTLGASDLYQYGFVGSPTSLRMLAASLAALAVGFFLVRFGGGAGPPNFRWSGP